MKHTYLLLITLLLMTGCQSSTKEGTDSFPEIKVSITPDEKEGSPVKACVFKKDITFVSS